MNERDLIKFITQLAQASGEVISRYYANPALKVEMKSDQTPVTEADRGAEEVMRRMIREKFPEHGIIGEEYGNENENAEHVWVLDPVDGTKAFAAGCPLFGTLICLMKEKQPVLGAIHHPILQQLLIGNNRRTTFNGRPVQVSATAQLSEALLLATDLANPHRHQNGANWEHLLRQVKRARTWGDCYGYLLLSCGGADIMTDPVLNPWDFLPLIPVVRGAGGVITDWQGNDPLKGQSIVAANPRLHDEVIRILNA